MATRVIATQTARRAAADLRRRIDDLLRDAQEVLALGDRLTDPATWDGPAASRFREGEWRGARAALLKAVQTLPPLRASAEGEIDGILRAGSGGVVAALLGPGGATETSVATATRVLGPPDPSHLAQRRAAWAGLTEEQRQQLLRSDPADYAYLATPAELRAAGYPSLQALYLDQSYRDAGINAATWNPSLGLRANDANVQAVYAFYQHVWDGDHNLQWAGMGKLAGAPVYGGLQDLDVLSQLPHDRLVQLAEAGSPLALFLVQYGAREARWFDTQFLEMQKDIYGDLAWQHDAYEHGGIDAIRSLAAQGAIDPTTEKAWEDINSGVPSRVDAGNQVLLRREQHDVIQGRYDIVRNHNWPEGRVFGDLLSENTQSPIPGGEPFRDSGGFHEEIDVGGIELGYDSSDITRFPDRWHWITSDMLPRYQRLLDDPTAARRLIDTPLSSRAQGYRMLPELHADGY